MTTTTPPSEGQALTDVNPQGQEPTSSSQAEQNSTQNTTLEELQRQIAELRRENASHRRRTKEQEEATQKAEQQRLAEQGEFKKLAEQHEAKVKELEPVAQSYTKLAEQVNSQIDSETKEWPAEVKAFDPGKDAPIEQRMEWMNKSRPLIDKITASSRSHAPGNSPRPTPTGSARDLNQDQIKVELLKSGLYKAF